MKVVFFGSSAYVLPVIEFLQKNYELALVVTTERQSHHPVVGYCTEQAIPFLSVDSVKSPDVQKQIKTIDAPVAVLASFGLIVPQSLLDIFPYGIINIHPSLLPHYRGSTPVQQALLDGQKETGVSVMRLDAKMDHGPLFGQAQATIPQNITTPELYDILFKASIPVLQETLDMIQEGKDVMPTEQEHDKATFTPMLDRASGHIDLETPPAPETLDRMIRAYYPWPGVWFTYDLDGNGEKVIKLLPGEKIQVEGKKAVGFKDFLNGYSKGGELLIILGLRA